MFVSVPLCCTVRVSYPHLLHPYTGLVSFSRARAALADPRAPVFVCAVDVLNCFDSLRHGPVLAILEELLSKSEYTIQHYARADVDADGNVIRVNWAEKVRPCLCIACCVSAVDAEIYVLTCAYGIVCVCACVCDVRCVCVCVHVHVCTAPLMTQPYS